MQKKRGFKFQATIDYDTELDHLLFSTFVWKEGSRGLQSSGLNGPMRAGPLVRMFRLFPMLPTDHLELFFHHYLPRRTVYSEAVVLRRCA